MGTIPYLALGLQIFGALSLATTISGTLSFLFSNFVRPGVSVRIEVFLIYAHSHVKKSLNSQLKKFGANKGAWAGERLTTLRLIRVIYTGLPQSLLARQTASVASLRFSWPKPALMFSSPRETRPSSTLSSPTSVRFPSCLFSPKIHVYLSLACSQDSQRRANQNFRNRFCVR